MLQSPMGNARKGIKLVEKHQLKASCPFVEWWIEIFNIKRFCKLPIYFVAESGFQNLKIIIRDDHSIFLQKLVYR